MAFCTNCGKKVSAGVKFCLKCLNLYTRSEYKSSYVSIYVGY
ncbi:MAG: zinc ribbon domain-containing protein [Butyrivibrio sp.]|nr:zinc ribbon domain-containing protein [Butyrivibrio sp.]